MDGNCKKLRKLVCKLFFTKLLILLRAAVHTAARFVFYSLEFLNFTLHFSRLFCLAEADNSDDRGNDSDRLVGNSSDRENEDVIYQHHRRGDENALAQKLIVAERDKDSIRRECYDKDQRVPSLPREKSDYRHRECKYSRAHVGCARLLFLHIKDRVSHKAHDSKRKSRCRPEQQVADTDAECSAALNNEKRALGLCLI